MEHAIVGGRESPPSAGALLQLTDLQIAFPSQQGIQKVVKGLNFTLWPGKTLCLVGESGSGKSVTAKALMGLLPPSARLLGGHAWFEGQDILRLSKKAHSALCGHLLAMIFQEPMTALNPLLSIGTQLTEGICQHLRLSKKAARQAARDILDAVGVSEPARRMAHYPHQLSGGMRQRVMIAMAMVTRPKLLIADEPTTALDVTVQAQILALMQKLQKEFATSIIFITHDLGVAAEIADDIVVMRHGAQVEGGLVQDFFAEPQTPYGRQLLAAVPHFSAGRNAPLRVQNPNAPAKLPLSVLSVKGLTVRFTVSPGWLRRKGQRVHAVEGVSFELAAGRTLALVGESGCGKSTVARAITRLVPAQGEVKLNGVDVLRAEAGQLKLLRQHMQLVFQDSAAALNPRMTAGEIVAEPLIIHQKSSGEALQRRLLEVFERVGLTASQMARYPHQFSGGQRQRLCIARALALSPKLVIADECLSALDVSIQAQILALLQELQRERGLSYLFISHDLAVVESIADEIAVMYLGHIVERGPTARLLANPQHPYTQQLIAAVPIADPGRRHLAHLTIQGEPPSPFRDMDYVPAHIPYRQVGKDHLVADTRGVLGFERFSP
jgi:peptide/nickel transport system ATP-binding protein